MQEGVDVRWCFISSLFSRVIWFVPKSQNLRSESSFLQVGAVTFERHVLPQLMLSARHSGKGGPLVLEQGGESQLCCSSSSGLHAADGRAERDAIRSGGQEGDAHSRACREQGSLALQATRALVEGSSGHSHACRHATCQVHEAGAADARVCLDLAPWREAAADGEEGVRILGRVD